MFGGKERVVRLLKLGVPCIVGLVLVIPIALYRPLPDELTNTTTGDRVVIHIFEPLARIFYYYPTRFFPQYRLQWMRRASNFLLWIVGSDAEEENSHLHMETTYWDGVKVRVYHPRDRSNAESDGAIIYTHGGGFSIWSTEIYESVTRRMAEQISARLFVSIDYRLAPETMFPGAIEDCERVLEFLIANGLTLYGIDPRKIIVMGDSAGGNLAAVIAQRRRRSRAEPKLLGQALIYPWLQMSDLRTPSYRYREQEMDELTFLDPLTLAYFTLWYAGVDVAARPDFAPAVAAQRHMSKHTSRISEKYMNYSLLPDAFRDDANCTDSLKQPPPLEELADYLTPFLTNPDFAPAMQPDLSDLPPSLVVTCEFDVLRDEGVIYAQRLKQAGVPTQWTHSARGFHGMLLLHNKLETTREMIVDVTDWTKKLLRESTFG